MTEHVNKKNQDSKDKKIKDLSEIQNTLKMCLNFIEETEKKIKNKDLK
jgi:hypothetical protein